MADSKMADYMKCVRVDVPYSVLKTSKMSDQCNAACVFLIITRPPGTKVRFWTNVRFHEIPDEIRYVPTSSLPPGICDVQTDDIDDNSESKNETEHWLLVNLIFESDQGDDSDYVDQMLARHFRR